MILEVCWDGLWTLSLGLSQFHGHGSWLVCEVALSVPCVIHPKLRNINFHNVIHSLLSRNPGGRIFIVQISLLIVTFLSLISQNMSLMQTTKEVNSHPHIVPRVNIRSVTFFFFFCHLLNVGACICHVAREGQVEWTTLV
jgi:hypothetical protein